MDPIILAPLAKEIWGALKGFLMPELEARLGGLSPDVRAAVEGINEAAAQAVIAQAIVEDLRAAADDPARAARVEEIKQRIEELRKGATP